MGFQTYIVWTENGKASWSLFLQNLRVADPNAAFGAMNKCIESFGTAHFSQTAPRNGPYYTLGFGEISWREQQAQRKVGVKFSYVAMDWVLKKHVTLEVEQVSAS
jgi:hypothetical protein